MNYPANKTTRYYATRVTQYIEWFVTLTTEDQVVCNPHNILVFSSSNVRYMELRSWLASNTWKQTKYQNMKLLYSVNNHTSIILSLITFHRSFQMEAISFFERGLRGERQTYPYMLRAKQRKTSLVWQDQGSNPWPSAHGVKAVPLNHRSDMKLYVQSV